MHCKFKENENIDEFADQFYYDAQILKGCGVLTTFGAKLALNYALKTYPQLSIAMVQPLVGRCPFLYLVEILRQTGLQCGLQYLKKKPHYNDNAHSLSSQPQLSSSSASSSKMTHNDKGTSFNSSSVLC